MFYLDGTGTFEFEDGFIVKGASQNSVKFWDEETRQRILKRHLEIKARRYKYKHGDKYRRYFEAKKKDAMRIQLEKEMGVKIPKSLKTRLTILGVPLEVQAAVKHFANAKNQSLSKWLLDAVIHRIEQEIDLDRKKEGRRDNTFVKKDSE